MSLTPELRSRIDHLVSTQPVVLFMKGIREAPQCGFSASVVRILDQHVPSYAAINVLADPALREAIKEYSSWPTIPQLYVRGEFVGGCDIVREMDESGELATLLGADAATVAPPTMQVTETAARALREALEGADPGECVRLQIDPAFRYDLSLSEPGPRDLKVSASGLEILIDPASARRAEGMTIDYVEGPTPGFRMDNPNAPASVRPMSATELAARLQAKTVRLIDVRTPSEWATARIEGATLLDPGVMKELMALPKDTPLVFQCHHGMRSQKAANHFVEQGFREVYNLTGGIDAWSSDVDPSVPKY